MKMLHLDIIFIREKLNLDVKYILLPWHLKSYKNVVTGDSFIFNHFKRNSVPKKCCLIIHTREQIQIWTWYPLHCYNRDCKKISTHYKTDSVQLWINQWVTQNEATNKHGTPMIQSPNRFIWEHMSVLGDFLNQTIACSTRQ